MIDHPPGSSTPLQSLPPHSARLRILLAYGLAVGFTGLVMWGRVAVDGWIGDRSLLIAFLIPIIVSSYFGGLGPGLLATLLVAFGTDYFLLKPIHSQGFSSWVDWTQWIILVVTGALVSSLNHALLVARLKDRRVIAELRNAKGRILTSQKEADDLRRALDEHVIVAVTDVQGKITYANNKFCRITKYSREELIGQDHRIVNSGYHSKEFFRDLWTTIARGEVWHGELRNKAKDGTLYWVDTTLVPFLNENGKPVQYVAIRTDITERRNTERELLAREAQIHAADRQLAVIVHGMTEACFALDANWRFTFVNAQSERLLKKSRPEMIGRTIWEVFPQLTGTTLEAHYRRAMKDREPVSFEVFAPLASRWLDIRLFPAEEGLAAFLLDIDGRKQAEGEIRRLNDDLEQRVIARTAELASANFELNRSREIFINLFESLPGLYLVLTRKLTIVTASDAYFKATGTTYDKIVGRGLFEVFPDNPDDPEADGEANLRASLHRVLKTAAPDTMAIQKYDVRRADGVFEDRYWSPVNSPVLGLNHEVEYIIHRVEDVTEFVRQKNRTSQPRDSIDKRMEQMEAEIFLGSQKVQAANQQLEAANKELEAFSYSVSHDLRAPLRTVDGFSQAILEDYGETLPAEARRYLQTIRRGAQQMGELIDDLLKFARLSRVPLELDTVDMNQLVKAAMIELHIPIDDPRLHCTLHELPACKGDRSLLRQVWVNLLSNAVKYSGRREKAVIEVGFLHDGRATVYFVRDNGAGFDMRYAEKLFGVFQRLHRAEDYQGTGVGLAIVQRVIHRHGGRVWAEAVEDRGAIFYFTPGESPSHE